MRSARQWHRHRYVDGNNLYTQFDIKYADIRQWDTYNLWYRILNYEHCRIIWSFLVRFWHIFMVEICKIGGDWVTLSPLYLSIGNTHTHTSSSPNATQQQYLCLWQWNSNETHAQHPNTERVSCFIVSQLISNNYHFCAVKNYNNEMFEAVRMAMFVCHFTASFPILWLVVVVSEAKFMVSVFKSWSK